MRDGAHFRTIADDGDQPGFTIRVIDWDSWRDRVSYLDMSAMQDHIRIGRAAEMLGVTVDTIRRWSEAGRITVTRTEGGQRLVPIAELTRLIGERRQAATDRPIVAQSARNRFAGIVTRVEKDRVAAVVEVLAGPHRLVSLMTAEAVDELGLKVGDEAICVVKSTNVVVEIPSSRESRA
jgi:molybdopterin-binding protein